MTELYPVKISEDCLYLNVYRPANATSVEKLPVMLFFHGGSYVLGASSFFIYNGAERIATGSERVIIVTANYRLQAFGYLQGELPCLSHSRKPRDDHWQLGFSRSERGHAVGAR